MPGLWLLALDSCLWRKNEPDGHPHVDGRFPADTLLWIEEMLIEARRKGKTVIAMMHHGLVEHYPANEKYYGEYVVDGSPVVAGLLASYGVRLVFTGHFHAQDITKKELAAEAGTERNPPPRFVIDVETGSLVTYPCPYRLIRISQDRTCIIESRFIRSIAGRETGFAEYARDFAFTGTIGLADRALAKYRVSEAGREVLSPQIAEAYVAHLAGDEKKPRVVIDPKGAGFMGRVVLFFQKDLVEGWWTDLSPSDNTLTIDLQTGAWQPLPAAATAAAE
jgi:hypothetical protein